MEQYQTTVTTSIPNAYAQAVVGAGGTASCQVGPAGVGTVWYPVSAAIATTSGAADGSTCTLYFGPLGLLSLVIGQSYAGGGDSLGLGVPAMSPGYFIVAIWTGAKAGDVATLNVIGTQDVLSP